MLRHPQNSGLQMDQLTRLYIPPFFIENLKIWQGDDARGDDGRRHRDLGRSRISASTTSPTALPIFASKPSIPAKHVFKGEWPIEKSML